ncbi:MAG: DUF1772 domain-containing protein [Deltaproteobacteria bacterium]|nr:DUF1772 domain-containing protein [Deltaproteobacteria bacterium]
MTRVRVAQTLLWLALVGWAIGLGAKLFDLVVLGSAWGANPPESLALMPYGAKYPVDPGLFFQPLSALLLLGTLGAVVAAWRALASHRCWLVAPLAAFAVIWALTPTVYWPMIEALRVAGAGKGVRDVVELQALVSRWMWWDSLRTALIAVGLVALVRLLVLIEPRRTP